MSTTNRKSAPPNRAGTPTREGRPATILEVNADRRVTIPAHVLEPMGLKPGDRLLLDETPEGYLLRRQRMNLNGLAPLRHHLRRGKGTFDIQKFRKQPHHPSLRD